LKDYADAGNAVFVSSHLLSEMSLMADNIVVIGKGKLIASTTVDELISGSKGAGVFIRTGSKSKLSRILTGKSISFSESNDGMLVRGVTTDVLGKMAYDANVAVLELTNHSASLEDAFLELTSGSEEFQGKSKVRK